MLAFDSPRTPGSMMSFTIAIIGRPNVGKSTLFNRLVGQKLALVDDAPGVTRDRREGEARLGDLRFTVIDTAGLDEGAKGSLTARMQEQTETAIGLADALMFVIDARAGLTPSLIIPGWRRLHRTTGVLQIAAVWTMRIAPAPASGVGRVPSTLPPARTEPRSWQMV